METDGWAVRVSTQSPSGLESSQIYYARLADPGAAENAVRHQVGPPPHAKVRAVECVIGAVFDDLEIVAGTVGQWRWA